MMKVIFHLILISFANAINKVVYFVIQIENKWRVLEKFDNKTKVGISN